MGAEEAAGYAKKAVRALGGALGKDHAALEPLWQALADLSAKVSCDLLLGFLLRCLPKLFEWDEWHGIVSTTDYLQHVATQLQLFSGKHQAVALYLRQAEVC